MLSSLLPYGLIFLMLASLVAALIMSAKHNGESEEIAKQEADELNSIDAAKKVRDKLITDPKARADLDKKYQRD